MVSETAVFEEMRKCLHHWHNLSVTHSETFIKILKSHCATVIFSRVPNIT